MDALLPSSMGGPSPVVINEVYRNWTPDISKFKGLAMFGGTSEQPKDGALPGGLQPWPNQTPMWDVYESITGMTSEYVMDGEVPVVPLDKYDTVRCNAMTFKESVELKESDFSVARALGTIDKLAGQQRVMQMYMTLNVRMWTRVEYMVWQAILDQIALNSLNVQRTITQLIPAGNKINVAKPWNVPATATIIEDLQAVALLFQGRTDGKMTMWINLNDSRYLSQNAEVRDLVKQTPEAPKQISLDNVGQTLATMVGRFDTIEVYDQGFKTPTSDDSGFTPFIPNGYVVITTPPPLGQRLGKVFSTPCVHNGGIDARPGPFILAEDELNRAKPRYKGTGGCYFVPALQFPQNVVILRIY